MTNHQNYRPAPWEKIVAMAMAALIVLLVGYLVVRNEPFADPNLALFVRILLSFATAVLGAVIPGFLQVDLSIKGWIIRAGGALALFVITYFASPNVLPIRPSVPPHLTEHIGYLDDDGKLSIKLPWAEGRIGDGHLYYEILSAKTDDPDRERFDRNRSYSLSRERDFAEISRDNPLPDHPVGRLVVVPETGNPVLGKTEKLTIQKGSKR